MEFREQQGTTFEEAERRYAELKRRHDSGQINDEQFDAERQRLLVVDDAGKWWAKSRESGRWHYNDSSGAWIEGTPPVFHRLVGSEDSPAWPERYSPGQPGQRPPAQRPGGRSRSGLLIGLGVLCAVLAVGLIAALAYPLLTGEDTEGEAKPSAKEPEPAAEGPVAERSEPEIANEPKKTEPKAADSKTLAPQEAVEAAVQGHYDAIGAGDFERAYSDFGPTFRSTNDEAGWVANERTNQIKRSTVNGVKVEEVSDTSATATVDVSFQDKSGTPRFVLTWDLVKEGGAWKLDSQTSGQKVN